MADSFGRFGANPNLSSVFNHFNDIYRNTSEWKPTTDYYNKSGVTGSHLLNTFGVRPTGLGLSSLGLMLQNEGRMDPRILANQLNQVSRETGRARTDARGSLAASGFGGSGLGKALDAAINQAGINQRSDLRLRDAEGAYARQQQNLGLLKDLVISPMTDYGAIGAGQYGQKAQLDANKQAGWIGALGQILGGLFS